MFPELLLHVRSVASTMVKLSCLRELPIKLPERGLFIAVLCVSSLHSPPLLFDDLEGGNGFLFCFDIAVSGRNQSSINRLN